MTGIIFKVLIADLAFVIHIIQYSSGISFFCRISDDAAHIDSKIISLLKGVFVARGIDRAQIVGAGNLSVIHHAGYTAYPHIAPDIARTIAVRHGCICIICPQFTFYLLCINYASCIILTNSMTPVDFPHDAAGVGCLINR